MIAEIRNSIALDVTGESLPAVRSFLNELLSHSGFSEQQAATLIETASEVVGGLVEYVSSDGDSERIHIEADIDDVRFCLVLRESVNSFQLPSVDDEQALVKMLERERDHELIFFPLLQVMDEVSYQYKKGFQNELKLIKFVPSA